MKRQQQQQQQWKKVSSEFNHDDDDYSSNDYRLSVGGTNNNDIELSSWKQQQQQTNKERIETTTNNNDSPQVIVNAMDYHEDDETTVTSTSTTTTTSTAREIQLYRTENLAVPLCYFMVGLVQGLIFPLVNVYPLDLGATEAQQTTLMSLKGLPSCLKLVFGIISDNFPIFGYRRKPYMGIGWMIASLSMLALWLGSDLSLERIINNNNNNDDQAAAVVVTTNVTNNDDDNDHILQQQQQQQQLVIVPENAPTITFLGSCVLLWAVGVWLADVMGDSLVAEKAKFETNQNRGNLQALCYSLRGLGIACMSPLSTLTYTRAGPKFVILLASILPLLLFPFMYLLQEPKIISAVGGGGGYQMAITQDEDDDNEKQQQQQPIINNNNKENNIVMIKQTKEQCRELWNMMCSRAVWQPMGTVYITILCFVSNAAWREYLKSVLQFTPNQLNALLIIAGALGFCGLLTYKFCCIPYKIGWRTIFQWALLGNFVFALPQILLIRNQTFGLNPFVFALGDDCIRDFFLGTIYLPMCIMMVNLVPTGIEGASYALFTTVFNGASALSDALSTVLLGIWDVSKETMMAGNLNGLLHLTLLTSVLQFLPISILGFIPNSLEELNQMKDSSGGSSSQVGGAIFLFITLFSIFFAVFVAGMNMAYPGWMGES